MKENLSSNSSVSTVKLSVALLLMLAPLAGGCASKSPGSQLRLQSRQSGRIFSQKFAEAYFAPATAGEYELVLIDDDGAREARAHAAGAGGASRNKSKKMLKPLEPASAAPLRQVVHIRVYWRPTKGTRADHPSATNAAIDWYVTAAPGSSSDRLHYQGAGFVEFHPKGDTATVFIRNAELTLVDRIGELHDPIGTTSVSGSATALRNDTMVAAISVPSRMDSAARARQAGEVQIPRGAIPER